MHLTCNLSVRKVKIRKQNLLITFFTLNIYYISLILLYFDQSYCLSLRQTFFAKIVYKDTYGATSSWYAKYFVFAPD